MNTLHHSPSPLLAPSIWLGCIRRWILLTGALLPLTCAFAQTPPCLLGTSPASKLWTFSTTNAAEADGIAFSVAPQAEVINGTLAYRVAGVEDDDPDDRGAFFIACDVQNGTSFVGIFEEYDEDLQDFKRLAFFDPPLFLCAYGTPTGQTCTWQGIYRDPDGPEDDVSFQLDSRVAGYESLAVPAGSYTNVMRLDLSCKDQFPSQDNCGDLADGVAYSVWIDQDAGIVRFAGFENGPELFAIELNTLTSTSTEARTVPEQIVVSPNYPNPFAASTTISFSTSVAGHLRLDVLDLTGRTLVTLVDEVMPPGSHEVTFDASRFSNGIYLSRMQAAGEAKMQKLVVMK